MFVDFDTAQLFGAEDTRLAPMSKRRLKSTNLQHVEAYFNAKYEYLEEHNFFRKMEQLKKGGSKYLAEKLDRKLVTASLTDEKKVPTYPTCHL